MDSDMLACALFVFLALGCWYGFKSYFMRRLANSFTEHPEPCPIQDVYVDKFIRGVKSLIEEYGLPEIDVENEHRKVYSNPYLEIRDMRTLSAVELRLLGPNRTCNIIHVVKAYTSIRIDPEKTFYISPANVPIVDSLLSLIDETLKEKHPSP